MNKVEIIGNLTKDPEMHAAGQNRACRFTIAVNGYNDHVDYLDIVAWNALGENCNRFLQKGKKVAVVGSIVTGSYERDGVKHKTFDIRADQVEFLTPTNQPQHSDASIDTLQPIDEDDMPF